MTRIDDECCSGWLADRARRASVACSRSVHGVPSIGWSESLGSVPDSTVRLAESENRTRGGPLSLTNDRITFAATAFRIARFARIIVQYELSNLLRSSSAISCYSVSRNLPDIRGLFIRHSTVAETNDACCSRFSSCL